MFSQRAYMVSWKFLITYLKEAFEVFEIFDIAKQLQADSRGQNQSTHCEHDQSAQFLSRTKNLTITKYWQPQNRRLLGKMLSTLKTNSSVTGDILINLTTLRTWK